MQALVLDSHERVETQVRMEAVPIVQRMLSSAASLDARSADSARDSDVKLKTAGHLGCQYGRRARCWSVGTRWWRCRGTKADRAALKAAGGPGCQYGGRARCWSVGGVWWRCRGAKRTKADRAALKAAGGPGCRYGRRALSLIHI